MSESVLMRFWAKRSDFSMETAGARGTFHLPWRGTDFRQNPPRAVAIIGFRGDSGYFKAIFRKISVMCELQHEGVMSLLAIVPGMEEIILVFPWMEHGSLEEVLNREQRGRPEVGWDATKKSIVIFGTAVAMAYAHSKNVLHHRLHTGKIFLNEHFEPVIGGFLSQFKEVNLRMNPSHPLFVAPELRMGDVVGDPKAIDVYAYGVTLFRIFSDAVVLDDSVRPRSAQQLMMRVFRGARLARAPEIPDCLWDLMCSCWAHKPEDRPTFVEIVEWLRGTTDWIFPGTDLDMLREYEERIVQGVDI